MGGTIFEHGPSFSNEAGLVPAPRERLLIVPLLGKRMLTSVQGHAAPDVGRDIQVLAKMNGRFAFFEAAFGDDFQGERALQHFDLLLADARGARLIFEHLLHLLRRQ